MPKAVLKTRALQTLRDRRTSPNRAKRVEVRRVSPPLSGGAIIFHWHPFEIFSQKFKKILNDSWRLVVN